MTTRVGRSTQTSAVTIPGVTGAYAALDAVGSAFAVPLAVGQEGALIAQAWIIDRASGASALRMHLFASPPTVIADNAPWCLPSGQENNYLGWIDFAKADWTTAGITGGNTALMNRALTQNNAVYAPTSERNIYVQCQAMEAVTYGGLNSAQVVKFGMLQD